MSDVESLSHPRIARRRRNWSDDQKRQIVSESLVAGASVAEVARRYDMNANLLFTWRRQRGVIEESEAAPSADLGALGGDRRNETDFVPATIAPDAPAGQALTALPSEAAKMGERRIEIALTCGRRIFVDPGVDVVALGRIVSILDRR